MTMTHSVAQHALRLYSILTNRNLRFTPANLAHHLPPWSNHILRRLVCQQTSPTRRGNTASRIVLIREAMMRVLPHLFDGALSNVTRYSFCSASICCAARATLPYRQSISAATSVQQNACLYRSSSAGTSISSKS